MQTHCPHGHELSGDNLYVVPKTGKRHCRTCKRDSKRKHSEENPDYNRQWNKDNPDYNRQWNKANPEKKRQSDLNWQQANPEKVRAKSQRRRALKLDQMGRWPIPEHEFIAELFEIYPFCYYCQEPLDDGFHVEHKIPLSRPEMKPDRFEGLHDFRNVRLACADCNLRKHNKTAEEFLAA